MADTLWQYDIYIPVDYKGSRRVERDWLVFYLFVLKWRFGGLTVIPTMFGLCKSDFDRIIIVRIFSVADSKAAIMDFAKCIARDLGQDEVLVEYRETNVELCRALPA